MVTAYGTSIKAAPPVLPPGLVRRHRLFKAVSKGTERPLTLVSAGPGWGKTVLLSSWAEASGTSMAWLSLDGRDGHPRRFWPLVGEALLTAGMVTETDGFSAFPHDRNDTSKFLRAFLNMLPDDAARILIIDDAHLLTDKTVIAEIDAIIRYGFPRLRLVLSARSDPLLPLHRYRLAGYMSELRAQDLAMSKPETRTLLSVHGVRLGATDLALLHQRTEGWVAGLRLSAMSMAGAKDPGHFVTQLAVDEGSVGEYLIHEVLNRQPGEVRRLLVQTSFLDQVSGELAAAVTAIPNSAMLLADLSRANSFVVPLDHSRDKYRYHQLLREVLRYLMERDYGAESAALHRRAAAWYETQGDWTSAIRFATRADDWPLAAAALVHGGFAQAFVERRDVTALGLDRLDVFDPTCAADTEAYAESQIAQAVIAVETGQIHVAERHLEDARAAALPPDADATATLVEIVAARRAGSVTSLDRATSLLLDHERCTDAVRSTAGLPAAVRIGQASTHFWEGRPHHQVEPLLIAGLAAAHQASVSVLELECLGLLQLAYSAAGRIERAKVCDARIQSLLRKFPALQRTAVHHLAAAHAAFVRGDLLTSARAVRRVDDLRCAGLDGPLQAAATVLRSWILIMNNQAADSHQLLLSAPELALTLPTWLAKARDLTLAEINTRLGRPHAALKVIREDCHDIKDPFTAVTIARALIGLGDEGGARRALQPVLISPDNAPPLRFLIDALLISAKLSESRGDEATAVEDVLRATALSCGSIVQPFEDARPMLGGLLSRHPQAADAWPQAEKHLPTDPEKSLPAATTLEALPQALTDREITVLRRLATTMNTDEIAKELCVSINTVKTHIAAIYRKLPAASRREAVARARRLELL